MVSNYPTESMGDHAGCDCGKIITCAHALMDTFMLLCEHHTDATLNLHDANLQGFAEAWRAFQHQDAASEDCRIESACLG